MSIKIDFNVENKTDFKISEKDIELAIIEALKEKNMDGDFQLDLKIVDKKEIQDLNREFRHKDYPTDVLSFPIFDKVPEKSDLPVLLGDIVICPEVLIENAKTYAVSENFEFINLIKHSVFHLLGFHHDGD